MSNRHGQNIGFTTQGRESKRSTASLAKSQNPDPEPSLFLASVKTIKTKNRLRNSKARTQEQKIAFRPLWRVTPHLKPPPLPPPIKDHENAHPNQHNQPPNPDPHCQPRQRPRRQPPFWRQRRRRGGVGRRCGGVGRRDFGRGGHRARRRGRRRGGAVRHRGSGSRRHRRHRRPASSMGTTLVGVLELPRRLKDSGSGNGNCLHVFSGFTPDGCVW